MHLSKNEIKRITVSVITIAVVSIIIVTLIKFYVYLNQPQTSPYAVMPESSIMVVHSDSITPDISRVFDDKIMQADYSKKLKPILEIIYDKYQYYNHIEYLKISIHPQKNHYDFLVAASMKKDFQQEAERKIKHTSCSHIAYKGHEIYHDTIGGNDVYLYHYQNLLVACVNQNLLRLSINTLELKADRDSIIPNRNNSSLSVSYKVSDIKSNPLNAPILYRLNPDVFGTIHLNINSFDTAFTGNADISLKQALPERENADITKYYTLLPHNITQMLLLRESAYSWLGCSKQLTIEQNKWFQYFQPTAVWYFTLARPAGGSYDFVLLSPKYFQETAENLFFLTQKDTLTSAGAHVHYDTATIAGYEVGRVNLPNFVYLRWNIGENMPRLKNYILLDDMILFAESDEALKYYLSSLDVEIRKNNAFIQSEAFFTSQADMMYCKIEKNHLYRIQIEQHDKHSCFLNVYYR